jgi:hypothetical protein
MNFELRTPNSELKTIFQGRYSLDNVLLEVQTSSPQRVLFWGNGAGGISSYVAGWMAEKDMDVILLDGANRFDPYVVSSLARRASIPPEKLLKRIRIARAFTCYQMATLMGEKLSELIEQEKGGLPDLLPSPLRRGKARMDQEDLDPPHRRPWVILLGPITTFLDEDVPEREVRPLFERSLRSVEKMAMEGVPFLLFQSSVFSEKNPPFTKSKRREGGLMDSKRGYLTRRLFQFSNLVWKISPDDQGPKLILEKGLRLIDGPHRSSF